MDSTLIQTEVIDELARRAGVYDEVSAITASAMRGEIDFKESFKRRIGLLKGLDVSVMKDVAENLPLTDGAERLFRTLKKSGYKTAILSGGFTYFGNYLKQKLGIDYVFANELEVEDGKLTGRHVGDIVDGVKPNCLNFWHSKRTSIWSSALPWETSQRLADDSGGGAWHSLPCQTESQSHGAALHITKRS